MGPILLFFLRGESPESPGTDGALRGTWQKGEQQLGPEKMNLAVGKDFSWRFSLFNVSLDVALSYPCLFIEWLQFLDMRCLFIENVTAKVWTLDCSTHWQEEHAKLL